MWRRSEARRRACALWLCSLSSAPRSDGDWLGGGALQRSLDYEASQQEVSELAAKLLLLPLIAANGGNGCQRFHTLQTSVLPVLPVGLTWWLPVVQVTSCLRKGAGQTLVQRGSGPKQTLEK